MADENENILVATQGEDALLATDIFTNAGSTAHSQIFKASWGDNNYTYKVNTITPLPVRIYGSTGDMNRTVVTGGVFGLGSFNIANTFSTPVYVAGGTGGPIGVSASVQGISGGRAVGITGSVFVLNNVGITGLVSVTGGRPLNKDTDSITVYGVVGTTRGWNLQASTDTVKISPIQGGNTHSTYIAAPNGTAIGASGDALKVYMTNVGLSLEAVIEPIVWIKNATGDILRTQGTTWISETNPTPVVVRGTKAYAKNNVGIQSGDMVVTFEGSQPVTISNIANVDVTSSSNLHRYLHGGTTASPNSVGVNVATMQSTITDINRRLNNPIPARIRNETTQINSMRNWFVTLAASSTTPSLIANNIDGNLAPIQGTHIKNLTYLRSVNDPPAVTIGIGTRNVGGTGFNLSLYLDPGESVFIPMSVANLYAKIVDKSIDPNFANATYNNALGIMSI